ncbi:T9SS type A sorting domain-containing protein [Taibaiella chishuiensis]|uniref:Putative secreted protein (Por secretion system target) n=1 Tax=Taibaiella chishuiensis TaxID=1434707 RepID=A0A2P8CZK2_9BACT|nr:T9SS type A sorting domain-containing protein [Taibaiella chishuiensis]PSK90399.1 putative secreted protein (Por secretion system target) [Taibaiella chishuiensis]
MKRIYLAWLPVLFGILLLSQGTFAQVNWAPVTEPVDGKWSAITYANGQFVAVGSSGDTLKAAMTSPDGFNWTVHPLPGEAYMEAWTSITYGNGLFVAVSTSGSSKQVMTSPDGVNWTLRNTPVTNNWNCVTFANGIFVAVSPYGLPPTQVMTSTDGITWTARSSAAAYYWTAVTYGNGLFVAVSASAVGSKVMTSPDAINWTMANASNPSNWNSVAYGSGTFVAVASGNIMRSTDGINWTQYNFPYNSWRNITYSNGRFMAVASYGNPDDRSISSTDGINWTQHTTPADRQWYGTAYGNHTYVGVAYQGAGAKLMVSTCNSFVTDSVVACDSFRWINNVLYTASNDTAKVHMVSAQGCDSAISLKLTIITRGNTIVTLQDTLKSARDADTYQWVDCANGNSLIPGATTKTFAPGQAGQYALITGTRGCADTTSCVSFTSTPSSLPANPNAFSTLRVSPQPAKDLLHITGLPANSAITLWNSIGGMQARIKVTGNSLSLPVGSWQAGIYILRAEYNGAGITKKIVIVK